jgi:hypothetical protein
MKELRLTFASEGFAAVSQVLVDMGLSFRVEPVGAATKEEAAPAMEVASAAKQRTPTKPARKSPAKAKRAAQHEKTPPEAMAAGAERLRAAIAKSGAAYRSPLEPSATAPEPALPGGGDEDSEQNRE